MKSLTLTLITLIVLASCNQSNNTVLSDQLSSEEVKDNSQLIKEINDRLHVALGNETVTRITEDHAYIFALNNDKEELEFYFELGYDSEGWPMEGDVYYFNDNKLIGYAYIHCDGCVGQDISSRLQSMKIKNHKTDDDLKEWDVIWSISEPSSKLISESSKILKKNLNITQVEEEEDGVSISTLIRNIYSNNENGFETFLSFKESYGDNTGIMTLSQKGCRYVYNIELEGNRVEANFFQSTCGANSSNTTLNYNPSNNTLSMFISGQEFTFYPEF
jgi:hypothetical protein